MKLKEAAEAVIRWYDRWEISGTPSGKEAVIGLRCALASETEREKARESGQEYDCKRCCNTREEPGSPIEANGSIALCSECSSDNSEAT